MDRKSRKHKTPNSQRWEEGWERYVLPRLKGTCLGGSVQPDVGFSVSLRNKKTGCGCI